MFFVFFCFYMGGWEGVASGWAEAALGPAELRGANTMT